MSRSMTMRGWKASSTRPSALRKSPARTRSWISASPMTDSSWIFEHREFVQQYCDVTGGAARAMRDLVAAAGAVGHDDGAAILTDRRQQALFGHLHRNVIMIGVIAEAASHAATGSLDQFRRRARDQPQHLQDRRHRPEGLLMTMAMQQNRRRRRLEHRRKAPSFSLARQEFLQQQGLGRYGPGHLAKAHRQSLIAQGQQTRRLQSHDSDTGLRQRQHV